jgi:FkbM family methyltransferase
LKKYSSFFVKRFRHRVKKYLFAKLASDALGVLVDTEFGPIICDPTDGHVSRQLLKWGRYNPDEIKLYRNIVSGYGSALIVGSHIGAAAFQLTECFDELVCIEANPATYGLLRKNILIRGMDHKMSCLNVAACNQDAPIPYLCNTENSGGSKIEPVFKDINYIYDSPKSLTVPGVRMDTIWPDKTFEFILMDIEGGEFNAILGGSQLIDRCSVFAVEYVPDHIKRVANKSIEEFAEVLIQRRFDSVEFPSLGIKGVPDDSLLPTLIEIDRLGRHEDAIIFKRT